MANYFSATANCGCYCEPDPDSGYTVRGCGDQANKACGKCPKKKCVDLALQTSPYACSLVV